MPGADVDEKEIDAKLPAKKPNKWAETGRGMLPGLIVMGVAWGLVMPLFGYLPAIMISLLAGPFIATALKKDTHAGQSCDCGHPHTK